MPTRNGWITKDELKANESERKRKEKKLFGSMNEINFTDFKDYCFQVELSQHFYVIHL